MISYRKIGGIHWLSLGPYRVSFCKARPKWPTLPKAMTYAEVVKLNEDIAKQNQSLQTWTRDEHNDFIFPN